MSGPKSITPAPTAFSQEATPGGFSKNPLMPSNTRTTDNEHDTLRRRTLSDRILSI